MLLLLLRLMPLVLPLRPGIITIGSALVPVPNRRLPPVLYDEVVLFCSAEPRCLYAAVVLEAWAGSY